MSKKNTKKSVETIETPIVENNVQENTTMENSVQPVQTVDVPMINQNDAVAVSVTFCRMGDRVKMDKGDITTVADKTMVDAVKRLFLSETYKEIQSFDGVTYNWLKAQSVPFMSRRGVRLVGKDMVSDIEKYLKERAANRQILVDAFVQQYPSLIANAQTLLNTTFDESDYKSIERCKQSFDMFWQYLSLGTPDNLPEDVKSEAIAKANAMWQEASKDVRDGLRVAFAKLVEHLVDRLTPAADGKKKRFTESSITNLVTFIDTLQKRNLTNDTELTNIANKAKEILKDASPEVIRASDNIKAKLQTEVETVMKACDTLITPEVRRKFDLTED